jgi:hypothetical protein
MLTWKRRVAPSSDRAGFVQWYLIDTSFAIGRSVVGEVVVQDPDGLQTYYAELIDGRGLRYFTNEDDAKAWLWSFYLLDKASED